MRSHLEILQQSQKLNGLGHCNTPLEHGINRLFWLLWCKTMPVSASPLAVLRLATIMGRSDD
jgi:hypothetical protein